MEQWIPIRTLFYFVGISRTFMEYGAKVIVGMEESLTVPRTVIDAGAEIVRSTGTILLGAVIVFVSLGFAALRLIHFSVSPAT